MPLRSSSQLERHQSKNCRRQFFDLRSSNLMLTPGEFHCDYLSAIVLLGGGKAKETLSGDSFLMCCTLPAALLLFLCL